LFFSSYASRLSIVAGKRTTKVERAIKYNIFVVTPEWLIDCYEQWDKKQEDNYILHPNYDVRKSRLFTKETPRIGKEIFHIKSSFLLILFVAFNDSNIANERIPSSKQKVKFISDLSIADEIFLFY
jgi:hypothetical protein